MKNAHLPAPIKNLVNPPAPVSSTLLTCVAENAESGEVELKRRFIKAQNIFNASGSEDDRFKVICLSLLQYESPKSLDIGFQQIAPGTESGQPQE